MCGIKYVYFEEKGWSVKLNGRIIIGVFELLCCCCFLGVKQTQIRSKADSRVFPRNCDIICIVTHMSPLKTNAHYSRFDLSSYYRTGVYFHIYNAEKYTVLGSGVTTIT